MPTIQNILNEFNKTIAEIYPTEEISSIAFIVIEEITGYSRTFILANKNVEIAQEQYNSIKSILERLKTSEPIQQILGKTTFYDLQLKITEDVLIPRQETEELISHILNKTDKEKEFSILDIGTGSGCIAIALKNNLPKSFVKAVDIDENAISLAKQNAKLNNLQISFKQLNFLEKTTCKKNCLFDIIVSNPPYVMNKEKPLMHKNVLEYEPHKALFVSDNDSLIFYKAIQEFSINHLTNKGMIFLEINENLGLETLKLFSGEEYQEQQLIKDLNGKDRFVFARKT